jgi:hypothetical protein
MVNFFYLNEEVKRTERAPSVSTPPDGSTYSNVTTLNIATFRVMTLSIVKFYTRAELQILL